MVKVAVILGSSRENGNTHALVDVFMKHVASELFILPRYDISPFDYQYRNSEDDYISLFSELLKYDHWVFATPMYWYSMSAHMKIFFDRISDVLGTNGLGKQLRGKNCSVLSTGTDATYPTCMEEPFVLFAQYLKMNYRGMIYCSCNRTFRIEEHKDRIEGFIRKLHV